jgi:hypothetical protein
MKRAGSGPLFLCLHEKQKLTTKTPRAPRKAFEASGSSWCLGGEDFPLYGTTS